MNKLLIICGPTATGKTQTAVKLSKKFSGEIVSADSRQVYRRMDIATGKDLAVYGDVPVWMLDVVDPSEQFSVAQYFDLAHKAVEDIWGRGKLPIVVGGTGLYIKSLVDGIETLNVAPDPKLRAKYKQKTADELFKILSQLDNNLAARLNSSERKNKARLIRKIELTRETEVKIPIYRYIGTNDVLFVGLTAPADILKVRINARIGRWLKVGAENEIKKLVASGVSWSAQAMNAIGYREWKPYFTGRVGMDKVITEWKRDEWQYAKRQMTWLKRDKRVRWFDISGMGFEEKVERLVRRWYDFTR